MPKCKWKYYYCHECGCHSLNCTSPMDYISHHALHSHIPVHHYTNHTAVTIHSLVLIVSPHLHLIHSHTFKQHSHMHSLQSLVLPWLTFWALFILLSLCLTPDWQNSDLGILNLCLWPRPLPGIVYVSALPLIFLFCLLTIAWLILSNKYCCKWIHSPLTSLYRRLRLRSSSVISTTQPNYGQHRPTPTSSPGRPDYGGVCSPVLWAVLPGTVVRRVSIQGLVLFWTQ